MNPKLKEKTLESLSAVLPITGIVLFISLFFVPMNLNTMALFLVGAVLLILGMGFFQLGAEISMTPIGEGIGVQISKTKKTFFVLIIGLIMGIIITISEPDLQVLAEQVPSIPNLILILTVAIGVGIFLAFAIVRIKFGIDLSKTLIVLYLFLIVASFFVPKEFIAVAFDSGGVTTGPMTVPFIMALGIGIASVRSDKNSSSDSFGLVALSSIGPILAVLVLGAFFKPSDASYSLTQIPSIETTRDLVYVFGTELPAFAGEVSISLFPIILVFFLFQISTHRYHKTQLIKIIIGLLYTFIGLVLFLCGVNIGFAPVGVMLGTQLATLPYNWILIPLGMLIGYFIVKAEPAIQILNHQVENVTDGAISVKAMNRSMSIGVAISIGLSMLRIILGFHIYWIIIPGYILALTMSLFTPKIFVGIAFDSGGVASGPMTSTFLLPLSIGACIALGGDIMTDAFGVVALVALTPLIAIQTMGVIYKIKTDKLQKVTVIHTGVTDDCDEIIDFEEV